MTVRIQFEGAAYDLEPGETVLTGLERRGVTLSSFCRTGTCQTCVLKVKSGSPPRASQEGLKESWAKQGFFLACICVPSEPLEVERCEAAARYVSRVERVERLPSGVLRVVLAAPAAFEYRSGQFIQLEREGGVTRPYSLASLPGTPELELHVAQYPGGAMSEWLASAEGREIVIRGPYGECFYFEDEPERPLLLVGTGTGLAPLLGIVREALAAGHRGPIHLYHGSPRPEGLYLWSELVALAERAPQLQVYGSVLSGGAAAPAGDGERCRVLELPLDRALGKDPLDWADCRVYLCGNPELVQSLKKRVYLGGAPLGRIHCDPFVAPPTATNG
jgi:NAD(P)H-flavin reductase/ferredoxin